MQNLKHIHKINTNWGKNNKALLPLTAKNLQYYEISCCNLEVTKGKKMKK